MRLEGQTKMGYYPTPGATLSLTPSWLSVPDIGRLRRYLDPCCGKGEALAHIANGHGDTYGIELSDVRAKEAEDALWRVLNCAYEYAQLADETFSLILLNPPYDGETITGGGKRMEETFLVDRGTTDLLVEGGILIYIIPHSRINETIARHLAGWYTDLRCFKLPTEEYDVFKQVVIFGVRRDSYSTPKGETFSDVMAWKNSQRFAGYEETQVEVEENGEKKTKKSRKPVFADLGELAAGGGEYVVPFSPENGKRGASFRWQYIAVSDEDFRREAEDAAARLDASRDWLDLIPATEPPTIEPAMTPKKGHIAMQMSGGLLGTNLVRDPETQQSLLIKGGVSKYTVTKHGDVVANDGGDVVTNDGGDPSTSLGQAGDDRLTKVETEERFSTQLSTLSADGELVVHEDPTEIGGLLEKYVEQLAEIVQARNVPQYDMKPDTWEWEILDPLSKGRTLPGRNETGLTEFQKHLVVALGRLCLTHGAGFINAEMGSGKTSCGIAIAEYLRVALERKGKTGAYPALVVGPGIVTGKENWPKEIPEVTPGAESRAVTVGAKPLPKPVKIGAWLKEVVGLLLDDDQFEGASVQRALSLTRSSAKKQKKQLTEGQMAALKQSLDRTEANPPARRAGAKAPNLLDGRIGGFLWLGMDPSTSSGQALPRDKDNADDVRREYSLAQFVAEHRRGELPEKIFAVMSFETAKLASGRVSAMTTRQIQIRHADEDGNEWDETAQVCACPQCGQVVAEGYDPVTGKPDTARIVTVAYAGQFIGTRRRFCQAPLRHFDPRQQRYLAGKWVWDAEKGKGFFQTVNEDDGAAYVCGAPLFEVSGLRRVAAAGYAKKKARHVFGLCLVDEIHKCKSKGTGTGWALTVLNNVSRWTVGLTGTLFGGYSTSIFWLLYRLSPEVRREFGFNDERRWTEKYGLLKREFYIDGAPTDDGAFTGTKFFETVSEKPGISPAIAGVGLKFCTFSSLKDIGLPLPQYSEEIVRLDMTSAMQEQYAKADGSQLDPKDGLFKWAIDEQKREDGLGKGAISVWLNTALHRPDAMFRPEDVFFNRRYSGRGKWAVRRKEQVTEFGPACNAVLDNDSSQWLGDWLPKELWTAEKCAEERRAGRKTLVYVKQTGTRDVQPRLKAGLEAHGLRAGILKPTIKPENRATWMKRHADEFDCLITNAKLVEVGLNLTMFNTAIFFEIEYSLYVVWQAMRRLYRPGAPKPVKLYFPVYTGTLSEAALDLIGQKMMAAQVFYGDEVGGALVDEGDDGDLLNDIVRKALGKLDVGRAEGIFALGNSQMATESPIGSPTAVSPRMTTLADLFARRDLVAARRTRKAAPVVENQMTLF